MSPAQYAKALVGMLTAVAGAVAATFPGSTAGKVAVVVAAGLASLAAVWVVPNASPPGTGARRAGGDG